MTPRFVCRRRRNSQVSVSRRWHLASRRCLWFLRGSEEWKSLPVGLATGHGTTAGTLWAILPRDRISRSEIYISLGFLRSAWLASDLQQTPTWSKLSPPGYRHMTQISSTGRRLWCHCWEMSLVTMWMSGVSSAARVSHTVRRSQNVLGTRVSDTSFFVTYLHKISILNHFRSRLKCVKLLLFFFFFAHACIRNGA